MKSKSLEKYLLSKYEIENLQDLKIEDVEELTLNKIGANNEIQDYDFRDFEIFPNLKYISLQNFQIKNYETNEIGRCKNLSAIQFSNCNFKSKSRLRGNIKIVSFNNCKHFNLKYLSALKNLEVLKVLNSRKINLKYINFVLKNLEKVYFENITIYNFSVLSKLKNLIFIEVINCKWNRNSVKLFSKDVQIEE